MSRYDFLRHIVNTKLSEYSKTRKHLIPVLDEVRRLISNAEDQYSFSIYGGKLENLAKYLNSSDFDLVINILKSANALDIIEDILGTIIEKYSNTEVVVEAARKRLEEIRKGLIRVSELKVIADKLTKQLKNARIRLLEDRIVVEYNGLYASIESSKNQYRLIIKLGIDKVFENYVDAVRLIESIYKVVA
mgnify:CR=1 FL=1